MKHFKNACRQILRAHCYDNCKVLMQQMDARKHLSNLWQCSKFNIITIITITTSEADVADASAAAAVDAARRATLNAIKLRIFILCFRFPFLAEHFPPTA